MDSPRLPPWLYNFVTLIDFTVTFHGLQDQLLSAVLTHEAPHLERQRFQLLESVSLDAVALEEMEDTTFSVLQTVQGERGTPRRRETFARSAEDGGEAVGRNPNRSQKCQVCSLRCRVDIVNSKRRKMARCPGRTGVSAPHGAPDPIPTRGMGARSRP